MHDITTVRHGEPVTVCSGIVTIDAGTFAGVAGGYIVIDHADGYPTKVEVDSTVFDVCDTAGRVLGVIVDDPVLETVPPDLE